jgi:transposase
MSAMPRHRAPYPPEFKEQMIALVRSGRSPESLSKEFEPTAQSTREWVWQADLDSGKRTDGLTTEERQELVRLRRDYRVLREEREILERAAAWLARETGAVPPKGTAS